MSACAQHHHPLHDAVEITPVMEWIRPLLRSAGHCAQGACGSTCLLPRDHADGHAFQNDGDVFVGVVRGRIFL